MGKMNVNPTGSVPQARSSGLHGSPQCLPAVVIMPPSLMEVSHGRGQEAGIHTWHRSALSLMYMYVMSCMLYMHVIYVIYTEHTCTLTGRFTCYNLTLILPKTLRSQYHSLYRDG